METLGSIALAVWLTLTGFLGIHTSQEPQSGALSVLTASQGGTGIGSATAGDVGKVLSVSSNSPFTYTLSSAGAGDVIGGSSLGTGLNIFDTKSSGILRFNTIAAGTNVSLSTTSNNNTIVISATAAANPYEIATTSNIAVPQLAYFTQTGGRTTLGSVATTTTTLSSEFTHSGTLGKLVGGADGTLSLTTNGVALTKLAQIASNSVLGNVTGSTGNVTALATSTVSSGTGISVTGSGSLIAGTGLTITNTSPLSSLTTSFPLSLSGTALSWIGLATTSQPTAGQLLYSNGSNGLTPVSTSTVSCSSGVSCGSTSFVLGGALSITNTGVTSNVAGDGISVSGATGAVTISNSGKYNVSTSSLGISKVWYTTGVSPTSVQDVATSSVTNGTGISFTGTAGALVGGTSLTITNSGVTSAVAGDGISVSGATGAVTISNSGKYTISTSSLARSGVVYVTGTVPTAVSSVATSSVTCTSASGISCTAFDVLTGGGALSLSSIPNSSLANSTISGIALGSNLANLSATDTTLTFSGTYNGGTARTVGINLANANTWTALQQFNGSASTTKFSSYNSFFGATATTTIDGAGNIVLPTGASLTDTGTSDGCATWSSGVLTTTGTACSGSQTPWTSEINGGGFGLANVRTIGIGTSSPYQSALTIDSGSASTTNTYHTGSVNGFLEVNIQNRSSGASASSDLVATADNGSPTTHYIDLGINGSGGGSAPFSTANHAYLYSIDDPLNIGALGTTPVMTFNVGGGTSPIERARFTGAGFGIGTSTPRWALTVSSSTAPQLTLTDASIGNAPFNFRAKNTSLFIGTSSPTTFATTTISMLTLDSSTGSTTAFKLDKSGTATSTFAGGIYLTAGCFSINGTCVGSGSGSPGGSSGNLQFNSASSFGGVTNSTYTSQGVGNGYLGLGTSTPKWTLQIATSTQPQLVLSDTTNLQAPWYFRSISGAFYMGTTSTSTFATTTTPVFSLDTNGAASFTSSITSLISLTAPIHYGGTAAGSTLTLRPTSGAGVGADAIIFGLGNNGANEVGRMTGLGYFGLGTTTPKWLLQIASSTRAQLTLSDASRTSNHYSFRSINSWLYLSTSSPTTFASTTNPVFSITPGGQVSVYAIQPATSTAITLDWEQTPNQVEYRIGGAATTITLINATTSRMWGSTKRVYVCNPGGTAGALTWAGVEWIGTAPTQTTTLDQCDLYSFNVTRATSTSAYKVAGAQSAGLQ